MCVNSFPLSESNKKNLMKSYLLNNILIINRFEYTFFTCFLNFSTQYKFIKDKISFFKIKYYVKFTNLYVNLLDKLMNKDINLHCQNIYQVIQHNDELFQVLIIHYHLVQFHNKNKD